MNSQGEIQLSSRPFQASYYDAACEPGPPRSTPSKLYRDSAGRIRIDLCVEIGSESFCLFRRIYDPSQNALFVLNDSKRTVIVLRHPAGAEVSVLGSFPIRDVGPHPTEEALGDREIEGIVCQGNRIGSTEYWISEELGGIPLLVEEDGEMRMRICDIEFAESDPKMFAIPDDYEIAEERE